MVEINSTVMLYRNVNILKPLNCALKWSRLNFMLCVFYYNKKIFNYFLKRNEHQRPKTCTISHLPVLPCSPQASRGGVGTSFVLVSPGLGQPLPLSRCSLPSCCMDGWAEGKPHEIGCEEVPCRTHERCSEGMWQRVGLPENPGGSQTCVGSCSQKMRWFFLSKYVES